jgi:hypothetical protein
MTSGLTCGLALIVALGTGAFASETAPDGAIAPKAEILGLWKGSSVCTKVEGNEFCKDETIVYNFVDIPSRPATVSLKAARIVDGTVQRTFDLYVTYRPDERRWACEFERGEGKGLWSFAVFEDGLTGTAALLPELTIVRNVTAKRTPREQVLAP